MKIRNAVLAATLGLAFAGATGAQVITYNPRTGDIGIDSQLGYMNDYYGRNDDYSRTDRDYFVDDIVDNFGAPRYLVNELLNNRNWSPGDVYYACALAYQAHRPCGDVSRMYDQDRGQGWGAIARRMGIQPGSAEFHALKGRVGSSDGRYRSHRSERGDEPGRDEGGKHDDPRRDAGPGSSDHGPGDQGKDNGKDKDKDRGKGKDKGKGKPH